MRVLPGMAAPNPPRTAGQHHPLQRSLLDRITGETEEGGGHAGSEQGLRSLVLRDLAWLLNTAYLQSSVDLRPYPEVASSTLNYGTLSLTGHDLAGLNVELMCRHVLVALRRFEPRLIPDSIRVSAIGDPRGGQLPGLRIEGELRTRPVPIRMIMRTEADPQLRLIRLVEIRNEKG